MTFKKVCQNIKNLVSLTDVYGKEKTSCQLQMYAEMKTL